MSGPRWVIPAGVLGTQGTVTPGRSFSVDMSGAINAAIAAAANSAAAAGENVAGTSRGGGTVYLPAGHYQIDSPIVMQRNVTLRGDGPSSWIQVGPAFPAGAAAIIAEATSAPVAIRDLRIELSKIAGCRGVNLKAPAGGQLSLPGGTVLSDLWIDWTKGEGSAAVKIGAGWDGTVVRRSFFKHDKDDRSLGYGVHVSASDVVIKDCVARDVRVGYQIDGSFARLDGCKAFFCGEATDIVGTGFAVTGADCVLIGCEAQDDVRGFDITGNRMMLVGCIAEGSKFEQFRAIGNGGQAVALVGCQARERPWRSTGGPSPTLVNFSVNGYSSWLASGLSMLPSGTGVHVPSSGQTPAKATGLVLA